MDDGNYVLVLFVDHTKAFDSVEHEILLISWTIMLCVDMLIICFRYYPTNRRQYVMLNCVQSSLCDICDIECGAHERSVLGPLLFLIYNNDLYPAIGDDLLGLFPGDTGLFNFNKDITSLTSKTKDAFINLY